MGSTLPPNKLRRIVQTNKFRDMSGPFVGARLTDDLQNIRAEINRDRAILSLPAPSGLYLISQPGAIELHWNELPESYRKSIDGARIWRARASVDDRKDFYTNQDKQIIVPMIRSTVYTDPVGNTSETFIYWVQWINLDGNPSEPSGGVAGVALFDSGAPGPLENLSVTGGDGEFRGSWSDPLTNILTLDNFAQQYSSTSGYTTAGGNICVTWLLGKIYSHQSIAPGETLWFRYAAHNQSGDTTTNNDPRLTALLPDGWGPWTEPVEGNPVSSGWDTGPDTGPPDTITVNASANGLTILFGAQAMNNQFSVAEGEIRISQAQNAAQMTMNLTTPEFTFANIPSTQYGARLTWAAPRAGRYFYSWRLRNTAFGWSDWTGDATLVAVPTYIDTNDKVDIGPPQGWTVTTLPGPDPNSVHVKTTRPTINGENLLWVSYQIRDTSGGEPWRAVDENAGAAVTYYDGSAINHKITDGGTRIYRETGAGFGTASPGDMILLDVRGGAFQRNYCQWGQITSFEGGNAATATYIEIEGGFRPQVMSGLRLKIVKYPHTWTTEGYLGNLYGRGQGWDDITNTRDAEFVSQPIPIDGNFNQIDARAWFENHYSRSDATGGTGAPTVSDNRIKVVKMRDDVIPGAVVGLSVTGADGKFTAKWSDPTTGAATIDDTAIQYTTDAAFTINGPGSIARGFGHTNLESGVDPGKTYYYRVAVHNQSGKDSHPSTGTAGPGFLGTTGWGPWTNWGSPSPVSSGSVPGSGGATDTVLPGSLQMLSVVGKNGEFIADWKLPATGYNTIDDHAIQYALDAAFTQIVNTSQGWGPGTHQQGTDPNKTYYFRIAAHNQSGLMSDSSTYDAVLRPTGWGPWTAYGAPTAVSSGLVPTDGIAAMDSLVPNGGFENDSDGDGKPDGWMIWLEGPGGGFWQIESDKYEGRYSLSTGSLGVARFGIASDAFPVREGELLDFSGWAKTVAAYHNGLYFQIYYHASNPNFLQADSPTNYENLFGPTDPTGGWTHYEKQFKVPAGMGYARITVWNWASGAIANQFYVFDDVQVFRRIAGTEIRDNTIPPGRLTGEGRTDFVETFEEPLGDFWLKEDLTGTATSTRVAGEGKDGGYVLRIAGSYGITGDAVTGILIPYDPKKLYRMSMRARAQAAYVNPGSSIMYFGLRCYNNAKTQVGDRYPVLNAFQAFGAWPLGVWQELAGWFKGVGAGGFGPAPDAGNPTPLPDGTAYIQPRIFLHGSLANSANITDLDDIRIEAFDEGRYVSAAPNGTFSGLTRNVAYPYPATGGDAKTSAANFYWSYTQGLVKAQQFAITVNDGNAVWVHRVRAQAGSGAMRHGFVLYGMTYNRNHTVSIAAEAIAFGGQVVGSTDTWGTFTPNANFGTYEPGTTVVGQLDWAGGNVWYDSIQYRNNIAPDNGTGAGITIVFYSSGSGGSRAVISGLNSYAQGTTNIATHLAVVIKSPSGTPVVYQDMVVTYISMGSLPASYQVPVNIPDNVGVTVIVAAVAETKNGRQFNTTFSLTAANTRAISAVSIMCPDFPADGQGRRVQIGHTTPGTDNIWVYAPMTIYQPMYMMSPNSTLKSYSAASVYQGGFAGDANGMYMANNAGRFVSIGNGSEGNVVFGPMGHQGGSALGVLCISNCGGIGAYGAPSAGGFLFAHNGAGKWCGPSFSITTFGAAGPHCKKCGYDFWLIATENKKWGASLHVCGVCNARYFKGPKTVLDLLTKQERSEIIHVETRTSRNSRIRRSDTRRKGQRRQGRLRCPGSKSLRARR